MIIFSKTYENVRTINKNFPIEDSYYANNNVVVVADGITRDPIGVNDLSAFSFDEMIKCYPRQSGGEIASMTISKVFKQYIDDIVKRNLTLQDVLLISNTEIKKINDEKIKVCDYLQNDYYGTVASCIYLDDNILHYAYICDCGIIVFDKYGNIKFQTEDDKEKVDPYINKIGIPWNLPEARIIVRRDFRNNVNNVVNGVCASYGALTGEETAKYFIKSGTFIINNNDIIIVYSDGFKNYFTREDFYQNLQKLISNTKAFDEYVEEIANSNYEEYGKEKTIVIIKK